MKPLYLSQNFVFMLICCFPSILGATLTLSPADTCTVNDECHNAIYLPEVVTNQSIVCVTGCNMYASPDAVLQNCMMGDFPTVWYRVFLDGDATIFNIEVYSDDFNSPVISLFNATAGCNQLQQVYLTSSYLPCVVGSAGSVKVIGTPVDPNVNYYIAVSSYLSIGGDFDLCVSALSRGFACVEDRTLEIIDRSNGGPLEGPFDPGETVSICLNINSFTAAGNGCQWFQGIVPVFGNGWDPSSFESNGQPGNAKVNGEATGVPANGLYGGATWDWFNDVDYHYDHPTLNIDDLDGNGRLDMCNSLYEADCPLKGVSGGCCGPCWGAPLGDILPGGWFAYGINGTCPIPGPPIRTDWGDGNTCGGGMGPWSFCFDLTTRSNPDCMGDSTRKDLSIGFFTFADGEVGAWTGDESVCALDHPLKLSLNAQCGRSNIGDLEHLPSLCSGDIFLYLLEEDSISHWEWNISPFAAVPLLENQGLNGHLIKAPLVNTSGGPIDILGFAIGYVVESEDRVVKRFTFTLDDIDFCPTVSDQFIPGSVDPSGRIRIYPMPAGEVAWLEWAFDLHKDAFVEVYNSQGIFMERVSVAAQDGKQKRLDIATLIPGIYFVSLGNSDFRYVTRLVKL